MLEPYLKSCAVLRCPSFPVEAALEPPAPGEDPDHGYGLNGVLLGDDCQPRAVTSLIHSPSEVALIGDSAVPRSDLWVEQSAAPVWPLGWGSAVRLQRLEQWPRLLPPPVRISWGWRTDAALAPGWRPDLHGGGSNFAFADGHAQFLRPAAQVIQLTPSPFAAAAASGPPVEDRAGSFPGALLE
jgi:prepilin-type processing-associated H-X9-DG protein